MISSDVCNGKLTAKGLNLSELKKENWKEPINSCCVGTVVKEIT